MSPTLFTLIGHVLFETVSNWSKSRQVKAKHKVKLKEAQFLAEIERAKKIAEIEADWDRIQARNSLSSWKDEFWTLVLATPLMMCFVPGLAEYAFEGFERLENVPEWYIIAVGVAIASAFGFRKIVSHFTHRRK